VPAVSDGGFQARTQEKVKMERGSRISPQASLAQRDSGSNEREVEKMDTHDRDSHSGGGVGASLGR